MMPIWAMILGVSVLAFSRFWMRPRLQSLSEAQDRSVMATKKLENRENLTGHERSLIKVIKATDEELEISYRLNRNSVNLIEILAVSLAVYGAGSASTLRKIRKQTTRETLPNK
jgi:hypothetical protein